MKISDEIQSLGEKFLPWPEHELSFRAQAAMPAGLRLSTDCPSKRILEFFYDHFDKVNEGVSLEGHLKADLFIQSYLGGRTELVRHVELPIDWSHGVTRLDAVVEDGPLKAHYELKTSSQKNPKPQAAQRRQVLRQRCAAALAGLELPPSVIFIIGKSGHTSNYVYGPFPIDPTDEELEETFSELEYVDLIMEDIYRDGIEPRDHPSLPDLCRCSDCFPPDPQVATDELYRLLDVDFEANIHEYERLTAWYKDIMLKIKALAGSEKNLYQSGRWQVSVSKNGRVSVRPRRNDA